MSHLTEGKCVSCSQAGPSKKAYILERIRVILSIVHVFLECVSRSGLATPNRVICLNAVERGAV